MIDRAFSSLDVKSFADLGGVWAVDGGYTFYALERFKIERACLVDTEFTEAVRARAKRHPQLRLIETNFGDASVVEQIQPVDAVLMFDVLLHQVDPDWDDILRMYAPATRAFVIVNPQFTARPRTTRLVDLGREGYIELVPRLPLHESVFSHLDEIHPKYGRPHRDIHEIWQWGIVDEDLDQVLGSLGFSCRERRDAGPWFGLAGFSNRAFLYVRD